MVRCSADPVRSGLQWAIAVRLVSTRRELRVAIRSTQPAVIICVIRFRCGISMKQRFYTPSALFLSFDHKKT